jgi:hypothetical protein
MQGDTTSAWVLGVIMGLLAVLGLAMASAAVDTIFYATGLALCLFGVLFVFFLIKKNTG